MKTKRLILVLFLALCCVVTMGIGLFCLWWYGNPAITVDYVAEFDKICMPDGYTAEDDGTSLFLKACKMVTEQPRAAAGIRSPWDIDANDFSRQVMREWVAVNKEAIDLLNQAMTKHFFWFKGETAEGSRHIWSSGPMESGPIYRLLLWRGQMKAYDGDVKGGIADILQAGNIGSCLQRPTWGEWDKGAGFAGWSCESLTNLLMYVDLSAVDLANITREVKQMTERWDDIEWPLRLRRLEFLRMVQMTFADDGHGDGRIIPAKAAGLWWHGCGTVSWIENVSTVASIAGRHPDRKATIGCYDQIAARWQQQWQTLYRKTTPLQVTHAFDGESCKNARLVEEFFPGYHYGFHTPQTRWDYANRILATIAILRFRKERGQLPESLADVVKAGYLEEIPRAWHNSEEFIYEKKGDSFVIYISVAEKQQVAEREHDNADSAN